MQATGPSTNEATPAPPAGAGLQLDPLGSLRKHPVLALVVATLIGALGLPLAYIKGAPLYSSTATIYVSPRFLANLQDDNKETELQSNSQYREYVQQQVRTVNRFDIVERALKSLGSKSALFVTKGETWRHAVERLQVGLEITPVPDTYQVTVTLQGKEKEGLADIVNAVVRSYLESAKTEEFFASDKRIDTLKADKEKVEQEVADKQEKRTEIAQELGVTMFSESFLNPYDKLLVDAKSSVAEARRNRIQAEASLASVDQATRPGAALALSALAQEIASKDTALTSIQANLNQRRAALMSTTSGMQPEHPGRKAAERELADLQNESEKIHSRLLKEYSSMLLEERKADAYKSAEIEKKLTALVHEQESQAAWFTTRYQEGLALGLDIDRARKRLNTIDDRIEFLSMEVKAPGFSRLFSAARVPENPVKGGRKVLYLGALFASLLLGLIAPIAVDFLDPRLRLPAEVEKLLGFALMGWLLRKKEAGPDFAREQIFRLASRIIQDHQTHGSRIFAFTSVKAQGGTTTVVTETALALTRLGAPALAVEANAYRADARYRRAGARGLSVILRGSSSPSQPLSDAIVPGGDDFPDCIPVGDVENEQNLPDVLGLIQLLRDTEGIYQIVLLDLPPLLVSVDAEILARNSDVTVLVVEAEAVTKPELLKAARALERLRPKAAAAILNKVHIDAGGGMGRAALLEFETGMPPAPSKWSTPWLWK